MITRENITEILSKLEFNKILDAMNSKYDFVLLELNIFNSGTSINIDTLDYCEEVEKEAQENGNLFLSKEDFYELLNLDK